MTVTEDSLLGGRVRLRQPAAGYRAAIDPVLLAAAVPARAGQRVLDLGCGTGAAGLCLAARVPGVQVVGLERQPEAARLAFDNGLAVVIGDVAAPPLARDGFDHVMFNPPYQDPGQGRPPPDPGRAAAHVDSGAGLEAWLAAALALVRRKGSVTVIHRADRLDALLAGLRERAGEIRVMPLWPGPDKPARRVVVRARKGMATPLELRPGLVLHGADGGYTPAADAVLRDAEALLP